jgi:hypothetical protein
VVEISLLVESWLKKKKKSSLKELQSLLGKLHFIAGCLRPGRIFVSRLLNWLRSAFPSDTVGNKQENYRYIPIEIKKDLKWWYEFLPVFNGVSMMAVEEWSYPDTVFSCDACLEGLGGMFEDNFVHVIFPPFITEQICILTV